MRLCLCVHVCVSVRKCVCQCQSDSEEHKMIFLQQEQPVFQWMEQQMSRFPHLFHVVVDWNNLPYNFCAPVWSPFDTTCFTLQRMRCFLPYPSSKPHFILLTPEQNAFESPNASVCACVCVCVGVCVHMHRCANVGLRRCVCM